MFTKYFEAIIIIIIIIIIINSIQEDSKSELKSGNAWAHSVQDLLFSSLLSKNIKIKIHRIIILPVVLCGCETWSFTFKKQHKVKEFDRRVPMK
jgi:hypothetical protein